MHDADRILDFWRLAADAPVPCRADDAAWEPAECFADEVAVDFPSMAPIVARMRGAFLAGEDASSALTTSVSLPRAVAYRGGRVPVQLSMPGTCAACSGRGGTWDEACAACTGAGYVAALRHVVLLMPSGVRHGDRLQFRLRLPHTRTAVLVVHVSVA
jgi:hypothetical protein